MALGAYLEESDLVRRAVAGDLDRVTVRACYSVAVSSPRRIRPSRDAEVGYQRGINVAANGARKRGTKSRGEQGEGEELHCNLELKFECNGEARYRSQRIGLPAKRCV